MVKSNMTLFKYTNPKNGLMILQERKLRFTQPLSFNDPFDSAPIVSLDCSNSELYELIAQHLDNNPEIYDLLIQKSALQEYEKLPEYLKSLISCDDIKNFGSKYIIEKFSSYKKVLETLNYEDVKKSAKELVVYLLANQIGIFCLSDIHNNLLMWSHYADSHKGIVIGFDRDYELFNLKINDFTKLRKVKYTSDRPHVNFKLTNHSIEENMKLAEKIYFTKSSEWEYELEYRVIKILDHVTKTENYDQNEFPIHLFPFSESAIKSVIIGDRVTKENITKVLDTLSTNNYDHVEIFYAFLTDNKYKLELKKIPD